MDVILFVLVFLLVASIFILFKARHNRLNRKEIQGGATTRILTEEEVLKIRELWDTGTCTEDELRVLFDIPKATVFNICGYKIWKHV